MVRVNSILDNILNSTCETLRSRSLTAGVSPQRTDFESHRIYTSLSSLDVSSPEYSDMIAAYCSIRREWGSQREYRPLVRQYNPFRIVSIPSFDLDSGWPRLGACVRHGYSDGFSRPTSEVVTSSGIR